MKQANGTLIKSFKIIKMKEMTRFFMMTFILLGSHNLVISQSSNDIEIKIKRLLLNVVDCGFQGTDERKRFHSEILSSPTKYESTLFSILDESIDSVDLNQLSLTIKLLRGLNRGGSFDNQIGLRLLRIETTFPIDSVRENKMKRRDALWNSISSFFYRYNEYAVDFSLQQIEKESELNIGPYIIYTVRSCYNRMPELEQLDSILRTKTNNFQGNDSGKEFYYNLLKKSNAVFVPSKE